MSLYDDAEALIADPDYELAPCGAVVHVDDDHELDSCELCDEVER